MDALITKEVYNSWIFQDEKKLKWWVDLHHLADENGEIHMSQGDLARRWNTNKMTVSRFLAKLSDNPVSVTILLHPVLHLRNCKSNDYKGECYTKCYESVTDTERSLFSPSPTPPTTLISKDIIVDNNAHTHEENFGLKVGVLASEERYIKQYQEEGLWIEAAMSAHLTVPQTQQIFGEFVVEQKHNSSSHTDYSDFKRHFLNYLRVKAEILRKQSNDNSNGNQRKYDDRRGTEVSSSADYTKPL